MDFNNLFYAKQVCKNTRAYTANIALLGDSRQEAKQCVVRRLNKLIVYFDSMMTK